MNDARRDASTPGSSSVDAYEEDWYRSLRALAERRRTELEQFEDEPEESEPDRRPAQAPPTQSPPTQSPPTQSPSPNASAAGPDAQRPAASDAAAFWATPSQPATAESPFSEPTRSESPTTQRSPETPPTVAPKPTERSERPAFGASPSGTVQPAGGDVPPSPSPPASGVWTTRRAEPDAPAVEERTPVSEAGRSSPTAESPGAETAGIEATREDAATQAGATEPKSETPSAGEGAIAGIAEPEAGDVHDDAAAAREASAHDEANEGDEEPSGTWARILRPLKRLEPSAAPQPTDESGEPAANVPTAIEPSPAGEQPEPTAAEAHVPGRGADDRPPETGAESPAAPPEANPTRVWSARAMVPERRVDTTRGTIEGPRRAPDSTAQTPGETGEPEPVAPSGEATARGDVAPQSNAPATPTSEPEAPTADVVTTPEPQRPPEPNVATPEPQRPPEPNVATPEPRPPIRPATPPPDRGSEVEPGAPTPEPQPAFEPPAPPPEPAGPSLTSRDPDERTSALVALEDGDPTAAELETVAALVLDPDAEIRMLAVDALARTRARLDDAVVRQALQDPADDVRAAAVRAAATRGIRDLPTLAPLIDARHSPNTHRTVLELLPKMLGEAQLAAEDLDPLLLAVAQLQPAPTEEERRAFSDIATAIGTNLLVEGLTLPDVRRLGAVRLLAGDRSHTVLHALSDRAGDPLEEVRQAGLAAAEEIARIETEAARTAGRPDIGALAEELRNPDAEHAERAGRALADVGRSDVVAWCREKLAQADAESIAIVAGVAAVLNLHEIGAELLTRGAALPSERRRPVVEALADFPDPGSLARLLGTVPSDTRPDAVRLVWEAAGNEVLPELRGLLADPAVEVRVAVIDIVREANDPSSIDAVTALLANDASADVRAAAVRTIAPTEGALASVIRALGDPDVHVRTTAVESMPSSPATDVGPALAQALTDLDERVRLAAIDRLAGVSRGDSALAWSALRRCRLEERDELLGALQRTNAEQVLEIALEHLSSPDQEERKLAVEMTGWGASQGAVESAIRALADPLPEIRRTAVDALGRLRDRSAVAALGNRLGDPDPGVRVGAVRALGVIDDEGVLAFLVAALKDPDHEVRETTSHVLTEWSSPAVAKRLAGVLAVPSLRDSATDLLRRIGPTSVELLIDVLLQGGAELRSTVGPLLEQIIGVDEFLRRMDSLEPERRLRAIEALGAIAGPMAVDALTRSLSDPDERIRLRSTQLLGELGDPIATDALRRLVDDPVAEVAAAARHALEANVTRGGVGPTAK